MEFVANEGKNVDITVNGVTYMRHAIKTHFVKQGEDYIEIFRKYVDRLLGEVPLKVRFSPRHGRGRRRDHQDAVRDH